MCIRDRPLMGVAGAGSLAQVVNAAMKNKKRMADMKSFFSGVGREDTSGIWEKSPNLKPQFREHNLKKIEKSSRKSGMTSRSLLNMVC